MTMPAMTEQQLKTLIKNYLIAKGHYVWVNNSGLTRSKYTDRDGITKERAWRAGMRGSSDIIGVEKGTGRFIAVECKVGRNKTTPDQDNFLHEVERRGGHAIIAYTLEDVQKYL